MMLKSYLLVLGILIGAISSGMATAGSEQQVSSKAIDRVVFFGDSISDDGNLYHTDFHLGPAKPYFNGRFSNGPVWSEDLAKQQFHFDISDSSKTFLDYAYGGAWAEKTSGKNVIFPKLHFYPPSFYYQAQKKPLIWMPCLGQSCAPIGFLQQHHSDSQSTMAHTLFVLLMGANDYLPGRTDVQEAANSVINNEQSNIESLIGKGAGNFMLVNLPDLGKTPYGRTTTISGLAANLSELSEANNTGLVNMIANLKNKYPSVNFTLFNLNNTFKILEKNPGNFGFTNITEACVKPVSKVASQNIYTDTINNKVYPNVVLNEMNSLQSSYTECTNPDEHLFWDHLHPSVLAHQFIAYYACKALSKNKYEVSIGGSAGEFQPLKCQDPMSVL